MKHGLARGGMVVLRDICVCVGGGGLGHIIETTLGFLVKEKA